ncbi:squalene--hopene cyclase [Bacillus sp. D386]|uniref:squalene--hopene cyclase n=1 Tax=Bacillus sp. D386 TaxID=2587155 RepID=UPI0011207ADA|nr:squalene--hopene cyclase [Bacillus sp. D386]
MTKSNVEKYIASKLERLEKTQNQSGSWTFNFEGSSLTDCFMILLIRTLGIDEEELMHQLVKRLLRTQNDNGSWSIYPDEKDGNLSTTVQSYTALLVSGKFTRMDEEMKRAEQFIIKHGGVSKSHFMTKMMLAVNGMYNYPSFFKFPMSYFMLPPHVHFNMYQCSNYARVHLTPMTICINKRFMYEHKGIDKSFLDGQEGGWFREERFFQTEQLINQLKTLNFSPSSWQKAGYQSAEKLMIDRIEKNGTLYSYSSATCYMIYALLALGYKRNSAIILKAVEGMKSYLTDTPYGLHLQNSPSLVWDTALLSYSLQEAGVKATHPVIDRANAYLLKKQQSTRGDWTVHAPDVIPGGWGFSDSNHYIPDNDDTSAVLRALTKQSKLNQQANLAWKKGFSYLKGMQNKDGGWGAFEKDAYNSLFAYLPIENAKDAIIDDSTSDLTGRVLEFMGNYAGLTHDHSFIKRAAAWLLKEQLSDGSWYGKWGVCYIYGTWAAVTGLCAIGIKPEHPSIQKAIRWLESIQLKDGGWGESCMSADKERYIPLSYSTPSQTAWALDALLAVKRATSPTIQKGVNFLINEELYHPNAKRYPTGLGLRGGFYIIYESYNYIFPLLALGHYEKKLITDHT